LCLSLVTRFEARPAGTIELLCCLWGDVFGADMRCELLVAPLFVVTFHLLERLPYGRTRRVELPRAFRAAPAMKILSFDPDQSTAPRRHVTSPDSVRYDV